MAKPSFKLIIYIMWVVTYMIPLERQTYQFDPADFLYMLLINTGLIDVAAFFLGMPFNGGGSAACMLEGREGSMHA